MNKKQLPKNKNHFKEMIVYSLGLWNLSDIKQKKVIEKISDIIALKISNEAWKVLSEEDRKEFNKISRKDEEKVLEYLYQKIGNFYQLTQTAATQVLEDLQKKKEVFVG